MCVMAVMAFRSLQVQYVGPPDLSYKQLNYAHPLREKHSAIRICLSYDLCVIWNFWMVVGLGGYSNL